MADSTTSRSRLESKVAIVTGSSSGLGRAIALTFAANGTKLVVCADLHPIAKGTEFGAEEAGVPTYQVICQRHGEGKGIFVKTNVTKGAEMENLIQEAVKVGGRLDM